jgi:predicted membrane-bound spermidine synthase
MRPPLAPSTEPTERLQFGRLKPTLLALFAALGIALLLTTLGVFDTSVFVVAGWPRAELAGAGLAGAAMLVATRTHSSRASACAFMLLPLLTAAASLAFEALTLVLCPIPFEFGWLWTPTQYAAALSELLARPGVWDLLTALLTAALSVALTLSLALQPSPAHRTRLLHSMVTALAVAVALVLFVPVAGSSLGTLPFPPLTADGVGAPALPRTGFVALPVVVLGQLFASVRHRHVAQSPIPMVTRGTALAMLCIALGIELMPGRSSMGALLIAALATALNQLAWHLLRPLEPTRSSTAASSAAPLSDDVRGTLQLRAALTVVFFFSGMAALLYQVVFAKGLALTFGSTSHASTIVLATYMAGLAMGSWSGGKLASRMTRPVVGYALAELGIAAVCAVAPITLHWARSIYVGIAAGANPSEPWLVGLQLALGAIVLVPPTWLMGLTLPLLTRQFLDERNTLGRSAGLLYTANTAGAAAGACITGYLVLPALGVNRSLLAAVITNVLVALFALFAATRQKSASSNPAPLLRSDAPTSDDVLTASPKHSDGIGSPIATADAKADALARRVALVATVQLTIGGFVTFGLETTFVHLLATVAGTSAYAFSLMLFAFLIGLSLGASLIRRVLPKPANLPVALLLCQLVLAATLLIACRYWDYLPAYFALFGRWPYTLTFAAREFVRFIVCLFVMLPPAICIGAQFPIAMEAVGYGNNEDRVGALGRASALNTLGNIGGALVVGFVLLPRLGSHRTLAALTLLCLGLAAMALTITPARKRKPSAFALAAAGLLLLVQPPQFDLTRLSSGGNVYFKPQYYGRVIDHAESLDGGLTAVAIAHESTRYPVKTLLTNGKFQGNDRRDSSGEMVAQASFAIAPLLHTTERNKALVIGFGTGTTTRVFDESGFAQVSVAELSGDIVTLADRHFATINESVIHRPNVRVHVTDGRNFLLLDRQAYDVISIELSSIWFAGAANLYNQEFYALLEPRLTHNGVLQQWVQLHRLSHRDIASILSTLHATFPHVWLYFLGKQGILVACKGDCTPTEQAVQLLESTPRLARTLAYFSEGVETVLHGRLLTPEGMERLLDDYRASTGLDDRALLSTDDNLYLEYSTPKGNVRDYDESIADNEAFLSRFRAPHWLDGTRLADRR